nr:hypothetical protein [Tanacetum cinerariifolium]
MKLINISCVKVPNQFDIYYKFAPLRRKGGRLLAPERIALSARVVIEKFVATERLLIRLIEKTANLVDKETANPVVKETANPVVKETANPVVKETANPVDKETANPVDKETANPDDKETANPVIKEKLLIRLKLVRNTNLQRHKKTHF